MMVAKIPTVAPMAENTSDSGDVHNDGQGFVSMLDEKKAAQANTSQRSGRPLPVIHFQQSADSATLSATDDETDTEPAMTGESMLALLSQTLDGGPGEDKKEKMSLSEEPDTQTVPLQSGGAQPVPLVASIDLPLLVAAAEQPAEITDATPDMRPGVYPSTDNISAALVNTNAKPELQVATGNNEQDVAPLAVSISGNIPLGNVSALNTPSLQPESNISSIRESESYPGTEQAPFNPEVNLSTLSSAQSVSPAHVEATLSTGALTQDMGTPAWQQSLGQQIAYFSRNGIQHAELRLHPEELGSLQINLQLKNEQAQLHFVSASHQVRAAIEAAVPHLRTSLAESGIELGQSSVGADTSSSWKDTGQPEQNSRQNFSERGRSENMPLSEDIPEISVRTISYNNGINTFA